MTDKDGEPLKRVLIAGGTGFVGRSLVPALLSAGLAVRVLTRRAGSTRLPDEVEVWQGDVLRPETLNSAFDDCDVAYYLVHSMSQSGSESEFAAKDREAAENVSAAAAQAGLKRIVYLGALENDGSGQSDDAGPTKLSAHLASRVEVGRIFLRAAVPATVLGAAIIVGPGGASYELLRRLVQKLPFMITPQWLESRIQPIALRDVLSYLILAPSTNAVGQFNIAGPDILSYHDMMTQFADATGIRRPVVVRVPVLTPKLSALWIDLVTGLPPTVTHPLLEGLRNELIADTSAIQAIIPLKLATFRESILLAMQDGSNEILS